MNRQSNYPILEAHLIPGSNSYANTQMQQQQIPDQRMQQNLGMNSFHGRPSSFSADQGNSYVSSAQWDRDAVAKAQQHIPMLAYSYSDAIRGGNPAMSLYQRQIPESRFDRVNEANKEAGFQSHEQDMEIGYEDNSPPLTLEGLEKKFHDEILKWLKEQNDAEDAEIIRHKEVIIEINNKYQEKLSVLRARQASQREEFLHKESEARLHQYQLAGNDQSLIKMSANDPHSYDSSRIRMGINDPHGYGGPTIPRAHQGYASAQLNSFGEEPQFSVGDRSQGSGGRIPYPEGRVYNQAGSRYC